MKFQLCFGLVVLFVAQSNGAELGNVSFNRDIRPILSDTCFHCHGFDPKSRKAGLRLDVREAALSETKNGVIPIVPGKPEESAIIQRLLTTDAEEVMPPVKAHKELTGPQKETFKRWVAEGAVYQPHWAYAPLEKSVIPKNGARNPVDAFILEKLQNKKIEPSPEASRARLIRRLSLDLTGLPPTPSEVALFCSDTQESAYEALVDRLLASPHFGERMAVWWLDIARFADTVGYHGDQNQRIFPYRDYVIGAFNSNKRFDQFTIEQLAGDLLPSPTQEQLVATGYNRLGMVTREGGAQPGEYLAKYGAERVRAVGAAWFGSTFGCAECHDHKFDPIKTADFYSLQAFFADVKQWGSYYYGYTMDPELSGLSVNHPFPPELEVDSPYLMRRKLSADTAVETFLAEARRRLSAEQPLREGFQKWIAKSRNFLETEPSGWETPPLSGRLFNGGKAVEDGDVPVGKGQTLEFGRRLGGKEELRVLLKPHEAFIAAVRLEIPNDSRSERTRLDARKLKGITLKAAVRSKAGKQTKVGIVFADAEQKDPDFDSGVEISGVVAGWKLPPKPAANPPSSIWILDPPVTLGADDKLEITVTGETVLPFRLSVTPFSALDPLKVAASHFREALLADKASDQQEALLADTWHLITASNSAGFKVLQSLAAEARKYSNGRTWTMVTQAIDPLTIRVLPRGNWQDKSGPVVLPATPSFLPGRHESTDAKRLTRLDLAHYIVSKENPITARTVMNRLWAMFFGVGLSSTIDDLGSQGELPTHPELLDFLATEFRDHGWDLKQMVKLLVTSKTYRQSSSQRAELSEVDPANRLLAAQNPRRLEAEFIRDNALSIAGALNLNEVGGPSVKPYQPAGYYDSLTIPERRYVESAGGEQLRRGLYTHWQRTFLHPMLANFDAPARDECAATRVVSNTPQQALTLLNDPTFVEAARVFAERVLLSEAAADEERMKQAFRIALSRDGNAKEIESLGVFLAKQREHFRKTPADARKLINAGPSVPKTTEPAELAAWTSLCRVLLNSQETITRY